MPKAYVIRLQGKVEDIATTWDEAYSLESSLRDRMGFRETWSMAEERRQVSHWKSKLGRVTLEVSIQEYDVGELCALPDDERFSIAMLLEAKITGICLDLRRATACTQEV